MAESEGDMKNLPINLILMLVCVGILGIVFLQSCAVPRLPANEITQWPYVTIYHDAQRSVTCWLFIPGNGAGISCLPDAQIGGSHASD